MFWSFYCKITNPAAVILMYGRMHPQLHPRLACVRTSPQALIRDAILPCSSWRCRTGYCTD